VPIICIERVIVAVVDLDAACTRWSKAGFAVASKRSSIKGLALARLYAGAIEIDLVAPVIGGAEISEPLVSTLERGGGILGWTWGVSDGLISAGADSLNLPIADDGSRAIPFAHFLPGVWTGNIVSDGEIITRRANLEKLCGPNENSVDYLEHIVVMTPSLEDAIAAHEKIGLPCKRVREAGGGVRQAFFKLEQTVLEIVGPGRGTPGVWGLAFMCNDIRRAVDLARSNGLEATAPKTAIQGGKIARIVAPLDGVAIAYMEPA
jgi:predicted enzyme related to lactoylglutathione lyase